MEAAPVEREGKRRTGHDLPPLRRGRPKPAVEPLQVGVRLDGACRGRTWALPPGAHPHGRSIGRSMEMGCARAPHALPFERQAVDRG